jgi:glycosyltransferase involved in cell wall biosynthesis
MTGTDDHGALSVLIFADNMSLTMSGETAIPYYYFTELMGRSVDARVICHARCRAELRTLLTPEHFARVTFIEDGWVQRLLDRIGRKLPYRLGDLVVGQLVQFGTQVRAQRRIRDLVKREGVQVILQPTPIAPTALSLIYGFGVPVVIGPMCGGLELPPGFRHFDRAWVRAAVRMARWIAAGLQRVIRGKIEAAALIVGNPRTAQHLPSRARGKVYTVVESGVVLKNCPARAQAAQGEPRPIRFLFCGRMVDWKGARYLVEAFEPLACHGGMHLDMIGDGELFGPLQHQVQSLGISNAVTLHGRLPLATYLKMLSETDVYVMPSLRECGGLALLEAMGSGLPIIASNWMGPAEYLDADCGILVDPTSESEFVEGLRNAMILLAGDGELRNKLGTNAQIRVRTGLYDWGKKTDRVLEILHEAARTVRVTQGGQLVK